MNSNTVTPSYNAGGNGATASSYGYAAVQPTGQSGYAAVQAPTTAYAAVSNTHSPYQTTPAVASAITYSSTSSYTPQAAVVQNTPSSSSSGMVYGTATLTANSLSAFGAQGANPYGVTPAVGANTTAGAAAIEAQKAKDKRARLIAEVTGRMRDDLQVQQVVLRDELDAEFAVERYLDQSGEAARQKLAELKTSLAAFEAALQAIAAKDQELSAWEEAQKSQPPLEAESRLEAYDDLGAQVVRLNAELNAIDDAFYFLERALVDENNKTVDLTSFLKETRRLARQQFMCKAHLMKINAALRPQLPVQQQQPQFPHHQQSHSLTGQQQFQQPLNSYSPTQFQQQQTGQSLGYLQPSQFNPQLQQTYAPQNGIVTQDWPQVPTASAAATIAAQNPVHKKKNGPKLTVL